MAMLQIFKVRVPRINYIFEDGAICAFVPRGNARQGEYLTGDPDRIAELERVIRGKGKPHPHIFRDPEEMEVDETLADPAVAFRAQVEAAERERLIQVLGDENQMREAGISADAVAKFKELLGAGRDLGFTDAKPDLQGIGSSTTMQPGSVESNGTAQGATKTIQIKKVDAQ